MENVENFILEQKERLWNDRKKLGLNKSPETEKIGLNAFTSSDNSESKYEREKEKEKLINTLTLSKAVEHDSVDIQQIIQPKYKNMVRFGEYSPLNPNFRNAGKPILGLGEYEERRRILLEHKKREYFEHIAQLKLGGIPMVLQSELGGSSKLINKENMYCSKYVDKAVQVDLLTDKSYNESKNINQPSKYVDEWMQATETEVDNSVLSEHFQDFEAPSSEKQSSVEYNETSVSTQKFIKEAENNNVSPRPLDLNRNVDLSTLSPRLRKLVEFYGVDGYVPSFPETPSPRGIPQKSNTTPYKFPEATVTQQRQLTYKEELRKQIEEKKRLEAERKEKEKQQDEAILRRVIQQQERMQMEYEKEQAQRRSRIEKVTDAQVQSKTSSLKDHENYDRFPIEENVETARSLKEFCDLPVASKTKNSSLLSICEIDVLNKPVINPEKSPFTKSCTTFNERNLSISPDLSTNNSTKHICTPLDGTKEKHNPVEPLDPTDKDVCQSEVLFKKRPVPTPRKSLFKKSDVINSDKSDDEPNKIQEQISTLNIQSPNLYDSLPIPILEAQATDEVTIEGDLQLPVSSHYNEVMSRIEDKWKVPVVQKNFLHTGNFPNTDKILTQLGAIRRQIQMDHLKFEERLRQMKKQSS